MGWILSLGWVRVRLGLGPNNSRRNQSNNPVGRSLSSNCSKKNPSSSLDSPKTLSPKIKMHRIKHRAKELGFLVRSRGLFSSAAIGDPLKKGVAGLKGSSILSGEGRWYMVNANYSKQLDLHNGKRHMLPCLERTLSSKYSTQSSDQTPKKETRKDISTVEDPFDDAPTYHIPQKPVTFTEGASYSVIILAGLGIAGLAAYAVFKELIFQPKDYKIFGKALERIQHDSQVTVRIGSPVTGYGSESRNRAARQRIPHRIWTDEEGVEHVEVNFFIRGPHGGGKVFTEMFKDKSDGKWKFTYLVVEIKSPTQAQLLLESYVPSYVPT